MFVSAKVHQAVREELAAEKASAVQLERRCASQQTVMDLQWLRITQLEKERSILFSKITGLPCPVPAIIKAPVPTSADHLMSQVNTSVFEDMGDENAARNRVDWNPDGTVKYS